MESSGSCQNCGRRSLIPDDVSGRTICTSCDAVQDFNDFQAHIGGITGDAGTNVRVGSAGTGSILNYKEKKVYEAQKLIQDFILRLQLSDETFRQVKDLIHRVTDGEYGTGNWFPVLVGACIYVVMRKEGKSMLPIVQVADIVGCDIYELGKMIGRVVDFVDFELPEFDIANAFERAIMSSPSFRDVSEDMRKIMLQQGVFLVHCLIKWCITTGRRPIPVVAAVLVFVGELNQVPVKIEEVAKELNVALSTCRRRYKELQETLVKVATQVLPWGKDVTVKNILQNAPFVIQYMEMKSMKKSDGEKNSSRLELVTCDMDGLADDCLSREIGYSFDGFQMENNNSQSFNIVCSSNLMEGYSDKYQISAESLAMIYSSHLDDISIVKANAGSGHKRKGQKYVDLDACRDWWNGKSQLSKKELIINQIVEKDVGWDDVPPSFKKGCLVKEQRRERIKAARLRIQKIMQPTNVESGLGNELCLFDSEKSKKRKKMKVDIDSEDLIIETLLLHKVKEEEIEKGYYNVLLDLHVFNDPGIE